MEPQEGRWPAHPEELVPSVERQPAFLQDAGGECGVEEFARDIHAVGEAQVELGLLEGGARAGS